MANRLKLSVVLATFNEAANIEACLSAVASIAHEIILVDGNSTDATLQMAKQFNPVVIQTTNKPMFHTNKQMAIDAAKGDWTLQLDADEVVDEELVQSIKVLLDGTNSSFDGYWIKRKNYFLGDFLTKGGQYPDPVIRLFRRGKGRLPQGDVHEQIEISGNIGQISGHLLHYNAPSFSRYITNANRYTSLTAQKLEKNQIKPSLLNDIYYLAIKPLFIFSSLFFRHRGYADGFRGLVFALFSALHFPLAYMKVADIYRKQKA